MQHLSVRKRSPTHHQGDARDTAERIADAVHLPRNSLRVTDEEGSVFRPLGVEGRSRRRWPAALAADARKGCGIGGPQNIGSFLRRVGEEADAMQGHVEGLGRMAGATTRFPIEVDERAEAVRLATDDGYG